MSLFFSNLKFSYGLKWNRRLLLLSLCTQSSMDVFLHPSHSPIMMLAKIIWLNLCFDEVETICQDCPVKSFCLNTASKYKQKLHLLPFYNNGSFFSDACLGNLHNNLCYLLKWAILSKLSCCSIQRYSGWPGSGFFFIWRHICEAKNILLCYGSHFHLSAINLPNCLLISCICSTG